MEDECLLSKTRLAEELDYENKKISKDISNLNTLNNTLIINEQDLSNYKKMLQDIAESSRNTDTLVKTYENEVKSLSLQKKLLTADFHITLRSLQRSNQNILDINEIITQNTNFCNQVRANLNTLEKNLYFNNNLGLTLSMNFANQKMTWLKSK